jgi:hypothetical protein
MLERKKVEENLHQRIKMEGHRPASFGSAWGGSQVGGKKSHPHSEGRVSARLTKNVSG